MKNKLQALLTDLGVSTEDSFELYYPRVRDNEKISVLKCKLSDVIILSGDSHIDINSYSEKSKFEYWGEQSRSAALLKVKEDSERRKEQFKELVTNKKWLDIGTGVGGILDELSSYCRETAAVEPQNDARLSLEKLGYKVYSSVEDIKNNDYEVVTLFHVLEHLNEPLETLVAIKKVMAESGKIIIEVPHAKDILLSIYELESFKAFTFWSEHLILHTKESLFRLLKAAGFKDIVIAGYQRYPLANHLHWLSKNKPSGHMQWNFLRSDELDKAYQNMLSSLDRTDTLIAYATK